jgi:hypothetical protein
MFDEWVDRDVGRTFVLNLCAGYKALFTHAQEPMRLMAELLQRGKPAGDVMRVMGAVGKGDATVATRPGRNEACFCGSGPKFKKCHGSPAWQGEKRSFN